MWGTLRESETSIRQNVAKAVAKADVIGRIGREEPDMTDMFDDFCRLRHVDGFSAKASSIVRSIAIACWLKRCAAFKQLAGPKMVQLVIQMGYPFSLWMVDQLIFSKRALSSEFGDEVWFLDVFGFPQCHSPHMSTQNEEIQYETRLSKWVVDIGGKEFNQI
jgi:hypothetical protein